MKTLVLYYSRTGTTASVAHALAELLNAETGEITSSRYAPGGFNLWRYLRAGRDSLRGHLPPVDFPALPLADYDLVVLGAPIWTSYPAVPLRSFLAQQPDLPSRVAVFFTCGGSTPADKATEMVSNALGRPVEASLTLQQSKVQRGEHEQALAAFADKLKAAAR